MDGDTLSTARSFYRDLITNREVFAFTTGSAPVFKMAAILAKPGRQMACGGVVFRGYRGGGSLLDSLSAVSSRNMDFLRSDVWADGVR